MNMKPIAKQKSKLGLFMKIIAAFSPFLALFLCLFLLMALAGGAASESAYSGTPAGTGVYPPNGMNIPLYCQADYPTILLGGGTIATDGCGQTAFAMVVSYLLGRAIDPPSIVSWAGALTYYVPGVGTRWNFFGDAVSHYQCGSVLQTSDPEIVLQALSDGRPVISSQGDGIFTSSGHFIVLRGVTADGKVLVNDPNDSPAKNFINREFDMMNDIHATASAYWIFDQRQVSTGAYNTDVSTYSQEELELIYAIVQQEDNLSYEGALAVISCAMNRVDAVQWSSRGNNALSQLTAAGQFCYSIDRQWEKWLNGNVYDYVKLAVDDCLNKGIRNHTYTSFRSTQGSNSGGEYVGGNYYFN